MTEREWTMKEFLNFCVRAFACIWPVTLKTFSALPTCMINIFAKFHWNPYTKYGYVASRHIVVSGQRTDGRMDDPIA